VVPVLEVLTRRVHTFIYILIPGFKFELLFARRHDFGRVTAMGEFLFVTVAAPWAGNKHHDQGLRLMPEKALLCVARRSFGFNKSLS
jgi:hypothetical protein